MTHVNQFTSPSILKVFLNILQRVLGLAWCPRAKPRWHGALHGALPRAKPRCHEALLGASRAKPRWDEALHGARPWAKPRHATRAMGPCLVPASQAKVARGLAWCPPVRQAKTHDTCHGALLGAREPSQDGTKTKKKKKRRKNQ